MDSIRPKNLIEVNRFPDAKKPICRYAPDFVLLNPNFHPMNRILGIIMGIGLFLSCSPKTDTGRPSLSVSIEPLKYLTEQITGNDFDINVLVPQGASPETYEPTAAQMRQVADSKLYIHIGLIDFEANLTRAIRENMPNVGIVRLDEGVPLLEGNCGHGLEDSDHPGHHHGVDPHIWTSPRCLKIMAGTLYRALAERYPDSTRYETRYRTLIQHLDSLDQTLRETFANGQTHFMIYHPALSYLARDYGLTQMALETEGKEPSADHIRRLIDSARRWQIPHILYQRQFSRATVDALARELGIAAVAIDPLGYDIEKNILEISRLIAYP